MSLLLSTSSLRHLPIPPPPQLGILCVGSRARRCPMQRSAVLWRSAEAAGTPRRCAPLCAGGSLCRRAGGGDQGILRTAHVVGGGAVVGRVGLTGDGGAGVPFGNVFAIQIFMRDDEGMLLINSLYYVEAEQLFMSSAFRKFMRGPEVFCVWFMRLP